MKDLQKKVAYLQGLAEGMDLDHSKEGKLIGEILGVLESMSDYIAYLQQQQEDLEDYLESVDSDLSDLEDEVFGDEDDEDEDEDDDVDEDNLIDVECPNCHETVCFDSAILYDDQPTEVTCPVCDAVVFSNDEDFTVVETDKEKEENKED